MPTGKRNYLPVVTVHPLTAHLGRRSTKCIGHLLAALLWHLIAGHLLATLLRHLIAGHLLTTLPAAPLTTLSTRHLLATPLILLSL